MTTLPPLPTRDATPEDRSNYVRRSAAAFPRVLSGEIKVTSPELDHVHRAVVAAPGDCRTERVDVLVAIAQYNFVTGKAMLGIEPAIDGLNAARALADPLRLMRALNVLAYCLTDTVDIAGAVEYFTEALELAVVHKNQLAECALWSGLGTAVEHAGQHDEARRCFERAVATAGSNRPFLAAVYTNLAWLCLHTRDIASGMHYAQQALAANPDPRAPLELLHRVLAESHFACLLLETERHAEAAERVAIAKDLATRAGSERAELVASTAEGLCEVARGQIDVGLSRLERLLDHARTMRTALRDTLLALVGAYRAVGQHDRAEAHLRELSHIARTGQRDYLRTRVAALWSGDESQPRALLHATAALGTAPEPQRTPALQMLERMALQADLVDDPTGLHLFRVGRMSALLAADYGVDPEVCEAIETAGRLHDIGKYALKITQPPGDHEPSRAEIERLRMHAEVGAELLSHANVAGAALAEDVARHHHERFDGLGYPDRLRGAGIPFAARIVAIANAFDSLAWSRGRRTPVSVEHALDEIAAGRSTRFDPQLTDLFLALVQRLRREDNNWQAELEKSASGSRYLQSRQRIAELLDTPSAPVSARTTG